MQNVLQQKKFHTLVIFQDRSIKIIQSTFYNQEIEAENE